jgi:hypothetical protein
MKPIMRTSRDSRVDQTKKRKSALLVAVVFLAVAHLQMNAQPEQKGRYAAVNGLKMYYEIHGSGRRLVLLHGGGSTIESTFGRILPDLAKAHQVIADSDIRSIQSPVLVINGDAEVVRVEHDRRRIRRRPAGACVGLPSDEGTTALPLHTEPGRRQTQTRLLCRMRLANHWRRIRPAYHGICRSHRRQPG